MITAGLITIGAIIVAAWIWMLGFFVDKDFNENYDKKHQKD